MPTNWLNENPFSHRSRNGTYFEADRCDLRGGVKATVPKGLSEEQLAADVAQMAGYHGCVIHPELNGFSGYDNLTITFVRE